MNRPFAIFGIVLIVILIGIESFFSRYEDSPDHLIYYLVANTLLILSLLFYCGFATLHAVQHVSDPVERAGWVILTVGFNMAGSCIYYCTKYQSFRKIGKGGLIRKADKTKRKFGELSNEEKKVEPAG